MRVRAVSFSLSLLILTTLHIALAPADRAAAQAPDPLTLTLTAERSECTAGTLNPVSWTITGGTAPYTLTVAGQSVDPTAESVNVTCGALPEGATEAPATISAVVTDAAGTTVTAGTAYTIVPPFHGPLFSERAAGVEPLSLTLTAVRTECTAGTQNPVVWTITGGTPPDTLTVDGALVNADAERTTVTCGNLPAGASEAPGTITASVTDASGASATAGAAYTIVPPLPAPAGLEAHALRTHMLVRWGDVPVPASAPSATPDCPCPLYLLRWRVADTDAWTTRLQPVTRDSRPGDGYELLTDMTEGTTYELTVAALRDAIERETPAALTWSPTVTETTIAPATRVRAVATHDTITVTWDPQPAASYFSIGLRRVGGGVSQRFTPDGATPHQVVFRHLPPKEQYTVRLGVPAGYQSPVTEVTVSTTAPPAAWTPLARGPRNLRTAVTHESVTVAWDAPYAGADDVYTVELTSREAQGAAEATVSGGVTTHTFTGLAPATRYGIEVTHSDRVSEPVEVAVRTLERPAAPLRLTLSVERAECTTGASTPVTWTLTGGTPPYTLTVAREPVAAGEGAVTAPCGGLRADGRPIPETIEAHVTDDTGAMASAVGTYIIVPPVPAPLPSARPAGVEPLALTLTAGRSECTAGTRNPVTWTITGGTPPDTLTIDGEPVNADAAGATVTCGALPAGATEAPATITASVTDASGATATASAAYTIVPPLPAPTGLSLARVIAYKVTFDWDAVDGAGSQSPPVRSDRWRRDYFDSYLFRYRAAETEATAPYEFVGPLQYPGTEVRPDPLDADFKPIGTGDYLGMVAAIRHTIEQETPAALNWSAPVPFGVARAPQNVVVQATPDTLDVSWDEQPYTQSGGVTLVGGGDRLRRDNREITTTDGRQQTRFHGLILDTEYEIRIWAGHAEVGTDGGLSFGHAPPTVISTVVTARTLPAPTDWEPLPRGPQNLRATATHDSITVTWDPPFAGRQAKLHGVPLLPKRGHGLGGRR